MPLARLPTDASTLVRSYLDRYSDPRIARAFGNTAPEAEGISGTPSFEDLLSHPGMRSILTSGAEGLEPVRGLTALKGVTVSVSVSLVDKEKNVVAECSWHAGRGISFRGGSRRD